MRANATHLAGAMNAWLLPHGHGRRTKWRRAERTSGACHKRAGRHAPQSLTIWDGAKGAQRHFVLHRWFHVRQRQSGRLHARTKVATHEVRAGCRGATLGPARCGQHRGEAEQRDRLAQQPRERLHAHRCRPDVCARGVAREAGRPSRGAGAAGATHLRQPSRSGPT